MMKRLILLSIMLLQYSFLLSQNVLNISNNAPRNNDILFCQQVSYMEAGENGSNVVWDFSDLEILSENYRVTNQKDSDSILISVNPRFMNRYLLRDDSLFQCGYESPITKIAYDKPILNMVYPFAFGNKAIINYNGHGLYCGHNAIDINGYVELSADAEGTIILSEKDSLENALRVHIIRTSSIGIEKDSLIRDTANRKLEIHDIYKWYVRGYRYPVFETQSISFFDNINLVGNSRVAFRYLPEKQMLLNDIVNKELLKKDSIERINNVNKIIKYNVNTSGGRIYMQYALRANAKITALVCNVMGMVYRRDSWSAQQSENNIRTIDCNGLNQGEYILYLNVNGQVYSNKIKL